MGSVKEVLHGVIIGGSSNDHEVSTSISRLGIQSSGEIQILFREVLFNVLVLDRTLAPL